MAAIAAIVLLNPNVTTAGDPLSGVGLSAGATSAGITLAGVLGLLLGYVLALGIIRLARATALATGDALLGSGSDHRVGPRSSVAHR